jgi:probable F420-dependent oxidoreductase
MDFGVGYLPTHDGLSPGAVARLVEERGHESLFLSDHTHIPADRTSPYPPGGDLPHAYSHTYELFVALAMAAAATSRLRIGSGVCLIVERDPITTAKAVASIDHLSGGRFEFGVGSGWNMEEMANHGTDPHTRTRVMRERVEAIKMIWTQEDATYHGRFVNFDRIWSWPKPAQRPHPPVLVGGNGPTVLDRVLAFGDAWFPAPEPRLQERMRELRDRAERPIDVIVMGAGNDPAELASLRAVGVRRAVHWLPAGGRSVVERALEQWEAAIAALNGES